MSRIFLREQIIKLITKKEKGREKMRREFGLVSIIMAAYNAENTIKDAVNSVLNQTYGNWELLVIDDCSCDETYNIVQEISNKDQRVRLVKNDVNKGVSYSRKRAAEEAKGQWIAILDSDDMWASQKLEKQIELQQEQKADLLYTGSIFVDTNGELIDWYLHAPKTMTYKQLLKQNLISNSSALVKKELYLKLYASGDKMHEDFATWLRILKTGVVAYGVDEPLLIYRLDKSSKSGNKVVAAKMNWNTYRYIGLNIFQSFYYEVWYVIKGLLKYRNLK